MVFLKMGLTPSRLKPTSRHWVTRKRSTKRLKQTEICLERAYSVTFESVIEDTCQLTCTIVNHWIHGIINFSLHEVDDCNIEGFYKRKVTSSSLLQKEH